MKENSEALGRQYREHKDVLQEALAQESYRISKLVKTDWRVDCVFGKYRFKHYRFLLIRLSGVFTYEFKISELVYYVYDYHLGTSKLRDTDAVNSLLASTTDAAKQVTAATELGMSVHLNISYDNRITNTSTVSCQTRD